MMYISAGLLLLSMFPMMYLSPIQFNSSSSTVSGTTVLVCETFSESRTVLEGEALYFTHVSLSNPKKTNLTWYKHYEELELISTDKKERIHFHISYLVFLDLLVNDTGLYTGRRYNSSGHCFNYNLHLKVLGESQGENPDILFGEIDMPGENKRIVCPQQVSKICQIRKGTFSWYKDFSPITGNQSLLRVYEASKDKEGIYTCICTWKYNHRQYNSSGSRRLIVKAPSSFPLEIISPGSMDSEKVAYEGQKLNISCSIYCGKKAKSGCFAKWTGKNGKFNNKRYNATNKIYTEKPSMKTIATEILTIDPVTADDFHNTFKCTGNNYYCVKSVCLRLKRGESIFPLAVTGVCVTFFCLLTALLVKCFFIDLTLLFRPYIQLCSPSKDARFYDAYVVYQTQVTDKDTEDLINQFVNCVLPSVLEEKCGYRLFIHGRDDLPGQDRVEMLEDNINKSRRLMVILTPEFTLGNKIADQSLTHLQSGIPGVEWHDWQVVLHHALVQTDLNVILIQLGNAEPGGYSDLSVSLQHLIRRSAPLRWSQDRRGAAAWNSRFWKKVRYLMPTTPSKKCQQVA